MTEYIKNSTLSLSSEKKHNTFLNKWVEITPTKNVLYIILFPAHSLSLLKKYLKQKDFDSPMEKNKAYSKANLHSYISSVLAIFKHATNYVNDIPQMIKYHKLWFEILSDNEKDIIIRRGQNKPTLLQELREGHKLTLNNLLDKYNQPDIDIMSKLLLAMYILIPPVRSDYYSTHIIKEGEIPETDNYIILKNGYAELVIRKYKTSKKHGYIHHPTLPNELYRIILESLKQYPRKYLFEKNNEPFTPNGFCKWTTSTLEKLFGVELTLTMIRHIYISSLDLANMTVEEKKNIGKLMGHTLGVQAEYEWKDWKD
jgi:hypothetical protein